MNRPKTSRLMTALASIVALMVLTQCTSAEELTSGTNSRRAKEQAIKSIPMNQLTVETQQKLRPIVQRPSIYRRLPVTSIQIDPDYYLHLVRHPEVIINIWKLMGVTQMKADRVAPFTLKTDDGVGTLGNVELVYGTNNLHIFYCEGDYNGSILTKNLRGKCVMVLRTEYKRNDDGETTAVSQLDIFLKIENATLGLIAKTLHPIIGSTADHNFVESINFLERLNETTVKNGPGVQGMAHRLDTLTQKVRQEFVQVAGLVYDRAQVKTNGRNHVSDRTVPARSVASSRQLSSAAAQSRAQSPPVYRAGFRNQSAQTQNPSQAQPQQPMQSAARNPYVNTQGTASELRSRHSNQPLNGQPGWQPHRKPTPVRQSFGDQPQIPTQNSRPVYSTSQKPYASNPYYNNR